MSLNRRDFVKGVVGTGVLLAAGVGFSGCVPGEKSSDISSISGTFEGIGTGMQGEIKISLEVTEGKITQVSVVDAKETPRVAKVALERVPAQIAEHQSLNVDTVTGATLASMGIMTAATNAAEAAGLDVSALKANKVTATAGPDETWDTDVLIIGGGGAAFSAAITAAQQGNKVTMIEKSSVFGGNTMMAGSAFNVVDEEAQDASILSAAQKRTLDSYLALTAESPELKFDLFPEWKDILPALQEEINAYYAAYEGKEAGVDMPSFDTVNLHMWHTYIGGLREMTDGSWIASDVDLVRTLAEEASDSFQWMDTIGLQTLYGKDAAESLYTVLGAMWPRTHNLASYDERIEALITAAEQEGIELHTETPGKELIVTNGKVTGAKAEKIDGTKVTINVTKGVVIASGGYCANPAMVKEYDKYWGKDLSESTLTTNLGTNEGDGIKIGQDAGAAVVGMEIAQMMPSSSPLKGTMTDGAWADAAKQIWIDSKGERFVNEYAERDVLAKASLKLEDKTFFIIYAGRPDSDICTGCALDDETNFKDRIGDLVDGGHIWYGETLAELAEATKEPADGVTPSFSETALRAIIEKYNTYFENQNDEDFGKEVISGYIDLDHIESTPGVGVCITPRRASLHHTMGGLVIDADARVLDENGKAITGLFAAGEVTGGIHAGNRLGGNAIADIFTYGRIAGMNVSEVA